MMGYYNLNKSKGREMKVTLEKLSEVLGKFQNKKLTSKLLNEIMMELNTTNTHQKTIEQDGKKMVWCNFHQRYEAAEKFAMNSKGRYKSNCKEGEKILRKFRALRRKLGDINLHLYRLGLMTPELEEELETKLTLDLVQELNFDIVEIIKAIYPDNIKEQAFQQIKIK